MRTIETADVVRIRFLLLDKRLLIDNRHNEFDGPLIKVVNRAGSSEESFRNLKRLRPRFPLPDKMTAIWWPKYVNTLYATGVWAAITRASPIPASPSPCASATRCCASCWPWSDRRSATPSPAKASRRSGSAPRPFRQPQAAMRESPARRVHKLMQAALRDLPDAIRPTPGQRELRRPARTLATRPAANRRHRHALRPL